MIADMAIASCEFMFEETRNYVLQRKAFGKTIAHLQVCINMFFFLAFHAVYLICKCTFSRLK